MSDGCGGLGDAPRQAEQLAVEFGIRTELNAALMKPDDFAPYMEHLA